EVGNATVAGDESICREHAGAASVGDHAETWSLRQRLTRKNFGHVEKIRDVLYAKYATATEGDVENFVGSGQRSGVRSGGFGSGGSASRLDDEDRLVERNLASGGQERARVADRLHIDDDRFRARIVTEVVDEVAPADVEHGTGGNEGGEAN